MHLFLQKWVKEVFQRNNSGSPIYARNRWVFVIVLKCCLVAASLSCLGREFQRRGASLEKDLYQPCLYKAVASIIYFGLNCTHCTGPMWSAFRKATLDPVSVFHAWIRPSVEPSNNQEILHPEINTTSFAALCFKPVVPTFYKKE